jgi:hypothetical protein
VFFNDSVNGIPGLRLFGSRVRNISLELYVDADISQYGFSLTNARSETRVETRAGEE